MTNPWRLGWSAWKRVVTRTSKEFKRDNLSLVAAGSAFFAFLAIFPALVALIALYGLVTDPGQVEAQLANVTAMLPRSAESLLQGQMERIAGAAPSSLGPGAIVGILVALWSANKGMRGIVQAINIAYDESETRGFFKLNGLTLGLTVAGVVTVAVLVAIVAIAPVAMGWIGLGSQAETLVGWLRWPVLAVMLVGVFALLYRLSPARPKPQWRWLTPGSVLATLLFLAVSGLFSLYVSRFGTYGETYGSVGAVAVLMLWLYLGSLSILLGAEINAEAERETSVDTTARRSSSERSTRAEARRGEAIARPATS